MPSTPRRKNPYPAGTDTPDVVRDLNALAQALDNAPVDSQGPRVNRPESNLVLGQRYTATDTGLEYRWNGTSWDTPNGPPLYVSSPSSFPATPVDGQRIYYNIGDQRTWHLRYNSGQPYPWEFLGGPSLHATNSTSYFFTTPGGLSYNTVGIGSQKLTLAPPRTGRYRVQWGSVLRITPTLAETNVDTRLASDGGTSGTTPVTSQYLHVYNNAGVFGACNLTSNGVWEGVVDTAGMVFQMRTSSQTSVAASVVYISMIPIAIQ